MVRCPHTLFLDWGGPNFYNHTLKIKIEEKYCAIGMQSEHKGVVRCFTIKPFIKFSIIHFLGHNFHTIQDNDELLDDHSEPYNKHNDADIVEVTSQSGR